MIGLVVQAKRKQVLAHESRMYYNNNPCGMKQNIFTLHEKQTGTLL